jgi:hypothetical protein
MDTLSINGATVVDDASSSPDNRARYSTLDDSPTLGYSTKRRDKKAEAPKVITEPAVLASDTRSKVSESRDRT